MLELKTKMLELKTKLSNNKKPFLEHNLTSARLNIIKIGLLIAVFGITLYSCKSSKVAKNDTTNAAIEKIAELSKDNILVCAHRSFHTNAPENSLHSIKNAIQAKIDIIEIDVRTTKDSVLVLMHDKDIDRITTGKGLIKNYTFSELQKFKLKMKDSITEDNIPLLEDALKMAKGKVIVNLDLKAVNYRQLYQMLKKYDMENEVISYTGTLKEVNKMLSIDSIYAVMPLVKTKEEMLYYHQNTKSPLQHFTDESFTQENMQWIHKNNKIVFINTLWDEDDTFIYGKMEAMDRVIALKPAIIQTDHPLLLINYLRSKKLHK
jgi:glycerophosphoryl diester phosphodiesterase